jgi:hypothetical protein
MIFVPVVPPTPPSPRTEELGRTLAMVVEDFVARNPQTTRTEVLRALRMAESLTGRGRGGPERAVVAVLVGLLMLGGFAFLYLRSGASPVLDSTWLVLGLVIAVAVVAVAVEVARRR